MKTALLAGSTGLIGSQLLDILLIDARYDQVIALSRKPLDNPHPKLLNLITDGTSLKDISTQLLADDVFCCLGTTMKQAGSKDAFRKVDFDYPVTLARISKELGAKQFVLVSALGANPSSSIFYNRVKGQTEEAIAAIGFDTLHLLRPSLLTGPRKEHRPGEKTAQQVYKTLAFLIPGKYKSIESASVARAMLALARKEQKGMFIHESAELQEF